MTYPPNQEPFQDALMQAFPTILGKNQLISGIRGSKTAWALKEAKAELARGGAVLCPSRISRSHLELIGLYQDKDLFLHIGLDKGQESVVESTL